MRKSLLRLWPLLALLGAAAVALGAYRFANFADTGGAAPETPPPPAAEDPQADETSSLPPPAPHPVSLPALMDREFEGRDLTVGRVLARNEAYTRYAITYKSGELTISGIMNVPNGNGPFPALILNHGYIDPRIYTTGRGLAREQDYLARRGYIALHTDYRNHAQSDQDPENDFRLRLGYTEDVVNAVLAVKGSGLPYIDPGRVGMLGRSMGGGVTLNALVVRPDVVGAAVLYAPVSSDAIDNFNRWTRPASPRRELAESIIAEYGSPEENPDFWGNLSPVSFLDRIGVPILIHHGTNDESVPLEWSQRTVAALESHGKAVEFYVYEGEAHALSFGWQTSMNRTLAFFDAHLGSR